MTTLLLFTDLDGTLLDHHSYDFQPAEAALRSLKTFGIPCIINTSKTFVELISLRQALEHQDPFIVENGSAVYIPKHLALRSDDALEDCGDFWRKSFGPHRDQLIALTNDKQNSFQFTRFSDMTCQELMSITGLNEENATQAMQRDFSEPMLWVDSDSALNVLRAELAPFDVQIQKGGRFAHLMGKECDKAHAMMWLKGLYQKQSNSNSNIHTIALGDGENDIGMLRQADVPVVIRSPAHTPPKVPNRSDAWLTESCGPEGWAQAVNVWLKQHGFVDKNNT
ncbi:HAD-IIB family hydrolase [Marinomonas sp. IMCC 4694]|uniref:HAD-IIB family hydrolase n=1 Tax=Marinomonas sp. IMCC 4694 TaxID=2605432 RepID=UPI0011E85315|nr:HAD-IIB family hydrolase [Marinomonas sp. IMCC 4694]TYL47541.1 HAD-IIB family hydrolase [Marinomonas sp. IMCC 4694]